MNKLISRSALAVAVLGANQALAGGLWLNEFGDFAAGRATAGAVAGTDKASTIIHNPAGAALIEGKELFLSAGIIDAATEFELEESNPIVGNDSGGDAGNIAAGAAMSYIHDLDSDKWSIGASIAGLSGASLDYRDQWAGRYQATDVNIILLAFSTSIAYEVTDKLTLGIAPQYYYTELELDVNLPPAVGPGPEDKRVQLAGADL